MLSVSAAKLLTHEMQDKEEERIINIEHPSKRRTCLKVVVNSHGKGIMREHGKKLGRIMELERYQMWN